MAPLADTGLVPQRTQSSATTSDGYFRPSLGICTDSARCEVVTSQRSLAPQVRQPATAHAIQEHSGS